MIVATLVCGMLLAACLADDNPAVGPTTELLNDGVWTGSGEGRSGTIVVKMTVVNHEITDIVVVSQSESSFAQEALNEMVARALQKQGLMSMEVDGVTGATLTSTGVIDAVNMAILAQPSEEAFLIFDQAVRQSLASIETYANQHLMTEGADAASLATKAGLPSSTLVATLERYASFQKTGLDEDFGRNSTQMTAALDTPPYYAIRVKPAIHHTMGGIRVDADMHVLRTDDTPVPGLFAAGEVTGGIHGANRLGGNGVADIVVNGKIAGRGAAMICQ